VLVMWDRRGRGEAHMKSAGLSGPQLQVAGFEAQMNGNRTAGAPPHWLVAEMEDHGLHA
jgi:hypothetical protein